MQVNTEKPPEDTGWRWPPANRGVTPQENLFALSLIVDFRLPELQGDKYVV